MPLSVKKIRPRREHVYCCWTEALGYQLRWTRPRPRFIRADEPWRIPSRRLPQALLLKSFEFTRSSQKSNQEAIASANWRAVQSREQRNHYRAHIYRHCFKEHGSLDRWQTWVVETSRRCTVDHTTWFCNRQWICGLSLSWDECWHLYQASCSAQNMV